MLGDHRERLTEERAACQQGLWAHHGNVNVCRCTRDTFGLGARQHLCPPHSSLRVLALQAKPHEIAMMCNPMRQTRPDGEWAQAVLLCSWQPKLRKTVVAASALLQQTPFSRPGTPYQQHENRRTSCERPTRLPAAPRDTTTSVADGSKDTIFMADSMERGLCVAVPKFTLASIPSTLIRAHTTERKHDFWQDALVRNAVQLRVVVPVIA